MKNEKKAKDKGPKQVDKEKKQKQTFKVPKIAWFAITWLFMAFFGVWIRSSSILLLKIRADFC